MTKNNNAFCFYKILRTTTPYPSLKSSIFVRYLNSG
jgi:hypothetical protein